MITPHRGAPRGVGAGLEAFLCLCLAVTGLVHWDFFRGLLSKRGVEIYEAENRTWRKRPISITRINSVHDPYVIQREFLVFSNRPLKSNASNNRVGAPAAWPFSSGVGVEIPNTEYLFFLRLAGINRNVSGSPFIFRKRIVSNTANIIDRIWRLKVTFSCWTLLDKPKRRLRIQNRWHTSVISELQNYVALPIDARLSDYGDNRSLFELQLTRNRFSTLFGGVSRIFLNSGLVLHLTQSFSKLLLILAQGGCSRARIAVGNSKFSRGKDEVVGTLLQRDFHVLLLFPIDVGLNTRSEQDSERDEDSSFFRPIRTPSLIAMNKNSLSPQAMPDPHYDRWFWVSVGGLALLLGIGLLHCARLAFQDSLFFSGLIATGGIWTLLLGVILIAIGIS
jgi:hypothetical protein